MTIHCETMTSDEEKELTIYYGVSPSPFGNCFIATTERGICHLSFLDGNDQAFFNEWKKAHVIEDAKKIEALANSIFSLKNELSSVKVLLKGTSFQLKVWQTLLSIPFGETVSYEHVAVLMGAPSAIRATASAIAKNPIAYLIPCHRVIRKTGQVGQYRWNSDRKQKMIAWERKSSYICFAKIDL